MITTMLFFKLNYEYESLAIFLYQIAYIQLSIDLRKGPLSLQGVEDMRTHTEKWCERQYSVPCLADLLFTAEAGFVCTFLTQSAPRLQPVYLGSLNKTLFVLRMDGVKDHWLGEVGAVLSWLSA